MNVGGVGSRQPNISGATALDPLEASPDVEDASEPGSGPAPVTDANNLLGPSVARSGIALDDPGAALGSSDDPTALKIDELADASWPKVSDVGGAQRAKSGHAVAEAIFNAPRGPAGDAVFDQLKHMPPEELIAAYRQMSPEERSVANVYLMHQAQDRMDRALAAHDGMAFKNFGKDLNMVPAIAIESDPLKKSQLVGQAYEQVMQKWVGTYDKLHAAMARWGGNLSAYDELSRPNKNADAGSAVRVARGGALCGEQSLTLTDTLGASFDDMRFPGNSVKVGGARKPVLVEQIEGTSPVPGINHAAVLLTMGKDHYICDPAEYSSTAGKFTGFSQSQKYYNAPMQEWLRHETTEPAWGPVLLNRFQTVDGKVLYPYSQATIK